MFSCINGWRFTQNPLRTIIIIYFYCVLYSALIIEIYTNNSIFLCVIRSYKRITDRTVIQACISVYFNRFIRITIPRLNSCFCSQMIASAIYIVNFQWIRSIFFKIIFTFDDTIFICSTCSNLVYISVFTDIWINAVIFIRIVIRIKITIPF